MKKFLILMIVVLVTLPGISRDFTYEYEGQTLTYTVLDEDAKTCKTKDGTEDGYKRSPGNSISGALTIPSIAKDGDIEYSITEIGKYAFYGCSGLTSVIIPDNVTSIGWDAFSLCYLLDSVSIPNNVTQIGESAFSGCSSLTSIEIPTSVTSISRYAFAGCSSLTSIEIPSSVTLIEGYAFSGCHDLISMTIPNNVTEIGESAFSDCFSLTSIEIPASVTLIYDQAFSNCDGLTDLVIEDSDENLYFGREVFTDTSLRKVYLGRNFDYSNSSPFYSSNISELTISSKVTKITVGAFRGSESIATVKIPSSVTEIGSEAFYECSGLSSVIIGDSVTSIGDYAFYKCSGLTTLILGNSVTEIGKAAFYECSNLTSVTIPNSVTSIGQAAFSRCSSLASVIIGNTVISIGDYAFFRCSDLPSVIIPNSVTSIGEGAFKNCSGLSSIIIGNSVSSIGGGAFQECSNLKKAAYPSGLSDPFRFDIDISIEYPGEGSIIENGFVFGPEKKAIYFAPIQLEGEYVIPESVTSIGMYAFYGCSGLTSVTIPGSVSEISYLAFIDCSGLKKSVYPSGLSNPFRYGTCIQYPREGAIIADGFVYGPEKSVIYFAPISFEGEYVIPESVSSIGECAFVDCSGLVLVKSTAVNPPTMKDNSFKGLYATVDLSIPEGAVNNYLATNWSLFENLRIGDSEDACKTYETGNLKYQLIPGKTSEDKNLAIVVAGDYLSLTEVTIPERFTVSDNGNNVRYFVDGIGFNAFKGCSSLATVTFNSRNTSKVIGDYAFAGTKISSITIPATVKSIGNYAFDNCSLLANIEVPGSVESIGNYAFYNTNKLEGVTLNEGLRSIGEKAFAADRPRFLEELYVPSTLQSIGNDAFLNFSCEHAHISDLSAWCNIDFKNAYSNPTANYRGLYLNGERIENLVIPESVNAISGYAFCNNSSLKTVKFNDSLQSIGASAFEGCRGLTSVTIPGNVTFVGKNAFGSTYIEDLTFAYGAEPIEIAKDAFPTVTTISWDRPGESINLKVNRLTSLVIGNSVTEIAAAGFKGAADLKELVLGNSLTAIGDEAFSGCTALTEIILPPSVETIGASAFAGNKKLTSIVMSHNVTTIGEKAYDLCPAQTVCITAQTPPKAPDNTFSNYTGSLYVQGQTAADAYYNADFCWYQFEGNVMIEPAEMKIEGDKTISGKPGDTFQLSAKLMPENVTLPQVFWRSTNPNVATVDANGLVTIHTDMSNVMAMTEEDEETSTRSCKIIAESLYANAPVVEFTVRDVTTDIGDVVNDFLQSGDIDITDSVQVYNLQGVMVSDNIDNLADGIYIVRHGNTIKKIAVK